MFYNRKEAGRLLAAKLRKYRNQPGIILAVPRGGVPVAYEVARELNMPLDIILVKKLGHPLNPEYAIGAVGLQDRYVVPHEDVTEFYIERETQKIRSRLMEMQKKFMGDKPLTDYRGKTLVIIDDGIATGNTLLATIKILKNAGPEKIVVAVPVASRSAVEKLSPVVDELITVLVPESFYGVGGFYEDFSQVQDEEVIDCINRLDGLLKAG
jgi:putative phosphoribosyl transferase